MKRIIGIILVCSLLLCGLTTFVGAEGEAPSLSVAMSADQVEVGDPVSAVVSLKNYTNGSWIALSVEIAYDPLSLSFAGVADNGSFGGVEAIVEPKANSVVLVWLDVENGLSYNDGSEVLAEVQFTALKETAAASPITVGFVSDGQVAITNPNAPLNPGESFSDTAADAEVEILPEGALAEPIPTEATITDLNAPNNTVKIDTYGKYISGGSAVYHNYKVDIRWDNMSFTYNNGKLWNTGNHTWEPDPDFTPYWSGQGSIALDNHSSKKVKASFTYTADGNNTEMAFSANDIIIDAPEITPEGAAKPTDPGNAELTAQISSGSIEADDTLLGIITVTLAAVE